MNHLIPLHQYFSPESEDPQLSAFIDVILFVEDYGKNIVDSIFDFTGSSPKIVEIHKST